jgi:Fe2+ transport system protein B
MIALLMGIFWLTITGANYPSQLISDGLFWIQDRLTDFFQYMVHLIGYTGCLFLVCTVYWHGLFLSCCLLWQFSFHCLPCLRIWDICPVLLLTWINILKSAVLVENKALTMCMGLGCNAAGIIGCRIIDSPRERLIAIITNNFVPCNGRFPTLIAILSMFLPALLPDRLNPFFLLSYLPA